MSASERIIDYEQKIRQQIRRVNGGRQVETDYAELRRLQQECARYLIEHHSQEMKSGRKIITIQRTMIRLLRIRDFDSNITIRCGKYRLTCNGFDPSVYDANTLKDVRRKPIYLKEFIGFSA